ncbi:hypothetical protein BH09ACT10_BH09ACT10_23720 [soil metagenome]
MAIRIPNTRTPDVVDLGRGPRFGLQLSILGAALGLQLFQGFSLGNIAQLLALTMLMPALKLLTPRDVGLTILFVASIAVSAVPLMLQFEVAPRWPQILFFSLCVVQIAICIRVATHIDARTALKTPINLAALFMVVVAAYQYGVQRLPFPDLFFDDKAHAATSAFCLSMLVLWANDGVAKSALALLVYFAGVTTASRTIFLGAPFLAIALLIEYRKSRSAADTPIKVYAHHLALIGVPIAAVGLAGADLAAGLLKRLTGDDTLAQSSSSAHSELARMATELKFADVFVTLFGTGPGGFSAGVRSFGISTGNFGYYDPGAYQVLMTGFAPIHSATLSILVEFPLWVAIAFIVLIASMARRLYVQREWVLLLLLGGLLLTTSFYSSHNEYFYTAYLGALCVVAFREVSEGSNKSLDIPRGRLNDETTKRY